MVYFYFILLFLETDHPDNIKSNFNMRLKDIIDKLT